MSSLTDNQLAQLYAWDIMSYYEYTKLDKKALEEHLIILLKSSKLNENSRLNVMDDEQYNQARKAIKTYIAALPERALLISEPPKTTFFWKDKSKKKFNYLDPRRVVYVLLMIVISLLTAGTLLALYALLNQSLNNIERFIYNEGWLQAMVSFSAMIAGATLGASMGVFLGAMPLIMLGFTMGLTNPVGVAIAGVVCFTIIGAALINVVANWFQGKANEKANRDELDPCDPYRFKLRDKEAVKLEEKGIDPFKVKCAIAALREKMDDEVPSYLNRLFSDREQQSYLKLVRRLRRGELHDVKVGKLYFNLRPEESEIENTILVPQ